MGGVISRDPEAAASTSHDLVVIGGGVYGVAVTHQASRLGLRVLLLEQEDFGGATSWNSLRILHGGIRSLQTLDLGCFRDMFISQGWFLQHFPEHVVELECLMPLYGRGLRRPAAFRAALALDQLLRRAWAIRGQSSGMGRGRVLDAGQTTRQFPLVQPRGLRGGGIWYDALMRHPQRVVIDWLRWACDGGAMALNRMAARQLLLEHGRVAGVLAEDIVTGTTLQFRARTVINCAGPWSEALGREFDSDMPARFRPTLAFNLLLDRQPLARCAIAVATPSGSRRTYFIVPWGEQTLVGTYHDRSSAPYHRPGASTEQIEQMLLELNDAVPEWNLRSDDVLRVWSGLLPGTDRAANEGLATSAMIHDHGRSGGPSGLLTVAGVKFTTAPLVAARVLRAAGFRQRRAVTEIPRPPARQIPAAAAFRRTLATAPAEAENWVRRLAAEESVLSVEDLLRRRTDWALDPRQERELEPLIRPFLTPAGARQEASTKARAG
ncbi:MAG TPA: FAD-dependent oxidoreductase [Gemmatimonadales bacterium]|nr:FAD-dependent oxidoreductase [Gemmatimonadales bacterium]